MDFTHLIFREDLIFEKEFPKHDRTSEPELDEDRQEGAINPADVPEGSPEYDFIRFCEFADKHFGAEMIPLHKRGREKFVELAQEVAEEFEFGIKILRSVSRDRVKLSLDFGQRMNGWLCRLIGMASSIKIYEGIGGHDVTLELIYDVLSFSCDGRPISPDIY